MNTKDLVAFGVRAVPAKDPLGIPLLIVSDVSDNDLGGLQTYIFDHGRLVPSQRFTWPRGRLQHQRAVLVTDTIGDILYNRVVQYVGVQEAVSLAP